MRLWGSAMQLQSDVVHIQTKVDFKRLKDAIVNDANAIVGNYNGIVELANELSFEPYFECTGSESRLVFVFGKNTTKRCFRKREELKWKKQVRNI